MHTRKVQILQKHDSELALADRTLYTPGYIAGLETEENTVYRAHLRSSEVHEKMVDSVYSKYHGLFEQSDRFRMGNP